jgi:hypothetical protein
MEHGAEVAKMSAGELRDVLERMPSRSARVLVLRLVEGRSPEACAAFYGISVEAFDVMLLRAADELLATVGTSQEWLDFDTERRAARALAEGLESGISPLGRAQGLRWAALARLKALAAELAAELDAAARAEAQAPRSRKEALIRKALVVLLAGAALYLYSRGQGALP